MWYKIKTIYINVYINSIEAKSAKEAKRIAKEYCEMGQSEILNNIHVDSILLNKKPIEPNPPGGYTVCSFRGYKDNISMDDL